MPNICPYFSSNFYTHGKKKKKSLIRHSHSHSLCLSIEKFKAGARSFLVSQMGIQSQMREKGVLVSDSFSPWAAVTEGGNCNMNTCP